VHDHDRFFGRVFVDHLFVINPDRTALLAWEETEYTNKDSENAPE